MQRLTAIHRHHHGAVTLSPVVAFLMVMVVSGFIRSRILGWL